MKLYEISQEIEAILAGTEDGELPADAEDRLTACTLAFEQKAEAILRFRAGIEGEENAIAIEMQRLTYRKEMLARRSAWLKDYLFREMQRLGIGKVSGTTFTATVCKSPPSVQIDEGTPIPPEFTRTKTEVSVDKTKILNDARMNKELPKGIRVVQNQYLKIS